MSIERMEICGMNAGENKRGPFLEKNGPYALRKRLYTRLNMRLTKKLKECKMNVKYLWDRTNRLEVFA